MADPILPGGYRAQCILQGRSNLPEDRFITSWAFKGPEVEPNPVAATQIANMLRDFWTVPTPPIATKPTDFLGTQVQRGAGALKINVYGLALAPPREAFEFEFNIPGSDPSNGLPSEVAICCSFFAGRNLPRSRGRIYFGPLTTGTATADGDPRIKVAPTIPLMLVGQMAKLQADSQVSGEGRPKWCVLSQADAELKEVTAGWVDDAFDTQRRRGEEAKNRTTWAA